MKSILLKLKNVSPAIFEGTPVLFAYLYGSHAKALSHRYSDLDIGIVTDETSIEASLHLELSLSLRFDEQLRHRLQTDVRILNQLPLTVKGRILGEARLIYSIDEEKRVAFETMVRKAYFDFLPVIQQYHQIYRQQTIAESQHGIA
jgi:predicted nucleotidyltransferase